MIRNMKDKSLFGILSNDIDLVEFIEDYKFNGKLYKKGHLFKVIGSGYRGLDLEDFDGNKIYETLFISNIISKITIAEIRDRKLNNLGI